MATPVKEDVVDALVAQHGQIKDLFARILAAPTSDRKELLEDLVRLLAVHEAAEEELVHPLARKRIESGEDVVEARLGEELHAKKALIELYELGVEDPRFAGRLMALRDALVDHANHEETEEFQELRRSVAPERLERMATTLRIAEATAPTRPHPQLQTAKEHLLLGPPLAIFDRMRDAIRDARE